MRGGGIHGEGNSWRRDSWRKCGHVKGLFREGEKRGHHGTGFPEMTKGEMGDQVWFNSYPAFQFPIGFRFRSEGGEKKGGGGPYLPISLGNF